MIIFLAASTDGTAVNDDGETPFDLAKEKDVSANRVGLTMDTKAIRVATSIRDFRAVASRIVSPMKAVA